MVKCADCGFLTLWRETASGQYGELRWQERQSGIPNDVIVIADNATPYPPKVSQLYDFGTFQTFRRENWPTCFVNALPITNEMQDADTWNQTSIPDEGAIYGESGHLGKYRSLIASQLAGRFRHVINAERVCGDFLQWLQGSTPKEHREMLDRRESRRQQQRQDWWNLGIALLGVIVAVIGIIISAAINWQAAQVAADAQVRSAQMQIEVQRELAGVSLGTPTPEPGAR